MKDKYKKALSSVENVRPKKYNYGHKTVVVLPAPIQKKDHTDYKYGLDIDEKVVKMACSLAERMAIGMVREMMSHINTNQMTDMMLETISDRIIKALPEQRTIIERIVSEESAELRDEMKDLVFEGTDLVIDRSKGLKLHGKVGETTKSEESTDDTLDALEDLL